MTIEQVRKRDGQIVPFNDRKIAVAISKAFKETEEVDDVRHWADLVTKYVIKSLHKRSNGHVPTIEEIQDIVETELVLADLPKTAKAYILYRHKRAEVREQTRSVPIHVKEKADLSKKYFRNQLAEFVYYRTYSRWLESEKRRETWIETVSRYINYMREKLGDKLTSDEYSELGQAIAFQEILPSMRLMQFAGDACRATNVCAYNCAYRAVDSIEAFAEIMYVSMCGTGISFSVESQYIQNLPYIQKQTKVKDTPIIIADSKEGWCEALRIGMETWFAGQDIDFDYSLLRPAGARLNTMGGKSSGPDPLRQLLVFTRAKILARQGKRLTNLDAHDICCKIGEVIVSGGVRRVAMLSLSDLDDIELRDAKKGSFFITQKQRSMANNSTVYEEQPDELFFMEEWLALAKSGSGERGIFNREGIKQQIPQRRNNNWNFGVNPCGEIVLRSCEFCNLSEIVVRPTDNIQDLHRKMRLAVILGTYQSMLTDFPYLSPQWKTNCDEEHLLGVSMTGQWDNPAILTPGNVSSLREQAIYVNNEYARRFGIAPSKAITCVKPSGNGSQLTDCSSGMHPRIAKYYIRRVRISSTDSLFHMMKDQKIPYWPEVGESMAAATTYVLEFPVKAPENAIVADDKSAIDMLEYWKMLKMNYTEHNPSATIYVSDGEWLEVARWLYKNWDNLGGLTFFPRDNHVYQLAPYEEITKEQYEAMVAKMPDIDFSKILLYEEEDETEMKREAACSGGACEL